MFYHRTMKNNYPKLLKNSFKITLVVVFVLFFQTIRAQVSFSQSSLNLNGLMTIKGATAMDFGPDGRLYVTDYSGTAANSGFVKALTIQRNGPTAYVVVAVEELTGVSTIQNHNDNGTLAPPAFSNRREVTGLTVAGTSANPVVYVTSSDIRIGGGDGTGQKDSGLDTNSGVITRMTKTGPETWEVVDIVRGLPRSEENHATNGLRLATINGTDYLIVTSGGSTNAGGPSSNFALITEYALGGAVLSVNLDQIAQLPVLNDNGRSYIYDLPTLDDPTRTNANGINDPDSPGYNGIDVNDPWGGNDGLNQAKLVPGSPVQIFSPGYRNTYDLVVTQSGAVYVTDNGANLGWGGFPVNEGGGNANNDYDPAEPGSQSPSGSEVIDNKDHLELVTTNIQNYTFGSFYGGHPNPIRANPTGAGLYTDNNSVLGMTGAPLWRTQTYDPDGSRPGSTTDPNVGLPVDWPPVPVSLANPVEGDWRGPTVPNPDGPDDNPIVVWGTNTNGITEYTASNFGDAMKGNLLASASGGFIRRVQLNANGTAQQLTQNFLSGIGGFTLGITANGDDEIFPGTIWAGTLNGIIAVFEPQDFVTCIQPGEPGYDALADYDFDGYTNQDELDNGTDICNGGSQPTDFDKILGAPFLSDLNDPDDDGDGISDALDPMQLGNPEAVGSQSFSLPIYNDLFNFQQGLGGIFGLGLTGLMNNGDTGNNWLDWLDRRDDPSVPNPNDVLGGAPGIMTSHMTSGTSLGTSNSQEKGYQYGVQVSTATGPFTVTGAMNGFTGPLRLYGNTAAVGGELGFQIGDGTQSNYIKFVVTTDGFLALQEIDDIPQAPITFTLPIASRPTSDIVFHFVVTPSTGQVSLEYQIDGGASATLGTIMAQGSILSAIQQAGTDLMVGFIGTSNTPGVELEGSWDLLNVVPANNEIFELRLNAGGPGLAFNGKSFGADQSFSGGQPFSNVDAQVPDLYKTERTSNSKVFSYNIPVPSGSYYVTLHFAEIFWGAPGAGSGGGLGSRIFDVSLEGSLVLDNYDIFAEVGAETALTKVFPVTVSDGQLTMVFSALAETGGVDQPKVSAIEVIEDTGQGIPISVAPIVAQTSLVGEQLDGSLSVVASGGEGNLSYSAANLPPGLFIEPTNGQIGGTVSQFALVAAPYNVTVTVDDSDGDSADAVTISFTWTIFEGGLWTDLNENENYTARHESSFVQAGNKFYLMGGRENAKTIDVYDYTSNTWTALTNSAPFEFNHFQATEYKGLIWVIGAFQTNDFPLEQPAEHIWTFDPSSNEWVQGPQVPTNRRRGSAGLAVYNDKFYIVAGNTIGHDGGFVNWFDEYDPATGTWTALANAPRARDHFHVAVIGEKLYVAGGRQTGGTGGYFNPVIPQVDVYDFSSSTWSTLPAGQNIPTPRGAPMSVNYNGKLVVIGGEVQNQPVYGVNTDDALKITEEYDPLTQSWTRLGDMNYERHGTQGIVSGNGIFAIAGSPKRGGGNQKNMEVFGADAPVGTALSAGTLFAPSSLMVASGTSESLFLEVSGGNVGKIVRSIEITGPDASDFSIVSGSLTNALLDANSTHEIVLALNNAAGDRNAVLTLNYGASSTLNIALSNTTDTGLLVVNPGTQNNNEQDVVSLQINATGGTGLSYSATGLPPTLSIDSSTGLITGTVSDGTSGDGAFMEQNGLVVVEAESGNTSGWGTTTAGGATGIIANTNSFSDQNGSAIPYQVNISTPGVYRFSWRSFYSGSNSTEENDNWLRFPNNDDVWFFGFQGAPDNEAEIINNLQGAQNSIVFPGGTTRQTAATTPNGASSNGYFKIFRSGGTSEVYNWQALTSDNNGHNVYVWFENPGTYTMEISERSAGHAIDKFALYKVDTYGAGYNANLFTNTPESPSGGVGPGAADNSPYNVEVTVTAQGNPMPTETIAFVWNIGEAGNQVPMAIAEADITSGDAPLTVSFTGSNSTDDVGVTGYLWDFKDGTPTVITADPIHEFSTPGSYEVTLTVSDGVLTNTSTITITVNAPANLAPVVTNPGAQNGVEGDVVTLQVSATDPEGDVLAYSATGLPTGLSIDTATGLISGTITTGASVNSPYAVEVTVTDDGVPSESTMVTFTWNVTDVVVNLAPVVTNPGAQNGVEGDVVTLQVSATDPEGDVLTYSATGLPTGLSIDTATGLISGTIANGASTNSPYAVDITVTDNGTPSESTTVSFMWNVTDVPVNQAPVVTNPGVQNGVDGDVVSLQVTATDPEDDVLTYSATGLPTGLSIDTATGLISGTIADGASINSPYAVDITVTDNGTTLESTTISFVWNVTDVSNENSIIIAPNPAGNLTEIWIDLIDDSDVLGVYIYDLSGRLVQKNDLIGINSGNGSYSVNTSNLHNGVYSVYVFISGKTKPLVSKLVVRH